MCVFTLFLHHSLNMCPSPGSGVPSQSMSLQEFLFLAAGLIFAASKNVLFCGTYALCVALPSFDQTGRVGTVLHVSSICRGLSFASGCCAGQ